MIEIEPSFRRWPVPLEDLEPLESAARQVRLSPERLGELAQSGFAPHWDIDGVPFFFIPELKNWVFKNIAWKVEGQSLPAMTVLKITVPVDPLPPPTSIAMLHPLIPYVFPSPTPSGVYFLCHGNEVVYVGKSINVSARVGQHIPEKEFDRAYYLPVPPTNLDEVEGNFIVTLKPKYNRNKKGELIFPKHSEKDIFSRFSFTRPGEGKESPPAEIPK